MTVYSKKTAVRILCYDPEDIRDKRITNLALTI